MAVSPVIVAIGSFVFMIVLAIAVTMYIQKKREKRNSKGGKR